MSKTVNCKLEKVCLEGKGSIISGPFGSNISKKYFVEKGIPVIRGNNLTLDYRKFIDDGFVFVTEEKADELRCDAFENDLIFTAAGSIGQVGIIPPGSKYGRYVISNKQIRARVNQKLVDLNYIYYWLSSPWIRTILQNNNKGSTVPLLTLAEVKALPISYPESLIEQRNIVKIISNIDEMIENNRNICSDLEAMAKLLYDYWFVQFDFPDENGKPYKSSGGKMVWNEELKREMPKGWEAKRIRDIAIEGKDKPYNGDSIETIDLSVMPSGNMMLSSINSSKNFSTNLFEMKQGDILFGSIRPYLKKAGIAPCNGAVAGTLHSFRPKRPSDYNFLAITLCNERVFDYATNASQGTKMPVVTLDTLMNYPIAYNSEISAKYNRINIKDIFAHCVMENLSLSTLRELLLPMLMNGQVKVGGTTE